MNDTIENEDSLYDLGYTAGHGDGYIRGYADGQEDSKVLYESEIYNLAIENAIELLIEYKIPNMELIATHLRSLQKA